MSQAGKSLQASGTRQRPKIALLIESSRAYGRGLLRGIGAYVRTHRPWAIFFEPHGLGEPAPNWLRNWEGDGILARITDRRTAELIRATGVPAVDLRGALEDSGIPNVGLDSRAAARMAFDHLRSRGFRHFGFCGVKPGQYRFLDIRAAEFSRIVLEAGGTLDIFRPEGSRKSATSWDDEQSQMTRWVADLPKPIGILACHDDRGYELLNACREAGVAVPDDVSVIGIDNDEVLCELSDPPLSSVNSNTEQIGYMAASILDQMMAGDMPEENPTLIAPAGVVARRSTDALAIADRDLAAAMRFVREHACDGINVEDILANCRLSRSTLDRRFHKLFGTSPKEELVRVRLEKVKLLLEETNYSLARIANLAGFEHPEHMGVSFRQKFGVTPGAYRQSVQRLQRPH